MPQFGAGDNAGKSSQKPRFGSGSGSNKYLDKSELRGHLVMITPIEITEGQPFKDGEQPVKILVGDTVVFGGPLRGEHPSIHWNSGGIVSAGEDYLRRAQRTGEPPTILLGRLRQYPQKINRDKFKSADQIEAAIDRAKGEGFEPPKHAWGLEKFTAADAALAERFLAGEVDLDGDAREQAEAARSGAPVEDPWGEQ